MLTLTDILAMPDGPEKKFRLLKMVGVVYRHSTGCNPRTLSCAELVEWITDNLLLPAGALSWSH